MPCDIFFSLRFNESGPKNEAKILQALLSRDYGINAVIVNAENTENIPNLVFNTLQESKMAVIFATEDYGAEAVSLLGTDRELQAILRDKKPFFLIKMCSEYQIPATRGF